MASGVYGGIVLSSLVWSGWSSRSCISRLQMVLISGGEFLMGTDNPGIPADGEGPQRLVHVESFYMDIQEVTNQQFESFVNASGYITEVWINDCMW